MRKGAGILPIATAIACFLLTACSTTSTEPEGADIAPGHAMSARLDADMARSLAGSAVVTRDPAKTHTNLER